MIGKILQEILDEKNMNVNELSSLINVSNQTLYSIIKRNNMKIDFDVLLKICSALDVNVERFYSDYQSSNTPNIILSNHEKKLVLAYRAKPSMQLSVDTLLEITKEKTIKKAEENNTVPSTTYKIAARDGEDTIELTPDQRKELVKAVDEATSKKRDNSDLF